MKNSRIRVVFFLFSVKRKRTTKRQTNGQTQSNLVHFSLKMWHLVAMV